MASIKKSDEQRNDVRFKIAGTLKGLSRFDISARFDQLVAECTDKQVYSLASHLIDALAEMDGFAELLCDHRVKLGKKLSNDEIEIDFVRGNIEWLGKLRKSAKKGGLSRAKSGKRSKTGSFQSSHVGGVGPGEALAESQPQPSVISLSIAPSISTSIVSSNSNKITTTWLATTWNEKCGSLPKVKFPDKLDPKRHKTATEALTLRPDPSLWEEAIEKMAASDFCNGRKSSESHKNWKAKFDFLLKPGTLDRVLEGAFDNNHSESPCVVNPFVAEMEGLANEL